MEALRIADEREDQSVIARILFRLGLTLTINGRTEEAGWLAERIEALRPETDPWELGHAFLSLGYLLYEAARDEEAEQAFTRAIACFRSTGEKHVAVLAESKLALLKHKMGDLQGANRGMERVLEVARQSFDLSIITLCVDDAMQLAGQQMADQHVAGEPVLSDIARIVGAVDHWMETLNILRAPHENSVYLEITENLRQRLGEGAYHACLASRPVYPRRASDRPGKRTPGEDLPARTTGQASRPEREASVH